MNIFAAAFATVYFEGPFAGRRRSFRKSFRTWGFGFCPTNKCQCLHNPLHRGVRCCSHAIVIHAKVAAAAAVLEGGTRSERHGGSTKKRCVASSWFGFSFAAVTAEGALPRSDHFVQVPLFNGPVCSVLVLISSMAWVLKLGIHLYPRSSSDFDRRSSIWS